MATVETPQRRRKIGYRRRPLSSRKIQFLLISLSFVLLSYYHLSNDNVLDNAATTSTSKEWQLDGDDSSISNSKQVQAWRKDLEQHTDIKSTTKLSTMTKKKTKKYIVSNKNDIRKCQYVMIDLGSNIGDALHKFIDSFLPPIGINPKTGEGIHYFFNTSTGGIGPDNYGESPFQWLLPQYVKDKITLYNNNSSLNNNIYPEDYCFYGVEGNPYFTPLLHELESNVLNMSPRPVNHLHFLTEHVGTAIDGPTTLFLDTINVKQNFWGSSIIQSHSDVHKSSSGGKGNNNKVGVMGITLTKLLKQTVLSAGHVIIKIDIEGAEYQLLEEAVKSRIFCLLVKEMGVTVDIIGEFHWDETLGSKEPRNRWENTIQGEEAIKNCGASYQVVKSIIPIW